MLSRLKVLLGITDTSKDILLNELLAECSANALAFTHLSTLTLSLENVVIEMAVYRYNLRGSEGLGKENYSGVSFDYNNDYPEYILSQLRCHRKVRTIG